MDGKALFAWLVDHCEEEGWLPTDHNLLRALRELGKADLQNLVAD